MVTTKIIASFFAFSFFSPLISAELIKGDTTAPLGKTFSFPIQQNNISGFGNFYVGAHKQLTENKEYALSRFSRNTQSFEPIAPEKVVVNGVVDQPNPLFGAKINALGLLKPVSGTDSPLAVSAANPAVVYLVEKSFNREQMSIVATTQLADAHGLPSSGIIALESNILTHVFAAVKPAFGNFGDPGSGIALMVRGNIDNNTIFGEVDAATGMLSSVPQALLLDITSPLVTMDGAPLSAMGTITSLHWDDPLKRLFIALQTTSNSGNNDGALSVVVGKIAEKGGLELFPIAPSSVFAPGNLSNIVGVRNASGIVNQSVTLHQIKTIYTSTGLNYVIVAGSVANDNESHQHVYALPLVNFGDDTGTLAQKEEQPQDEFSTSDVPRLIARRMTNQVTTQADMTQETDSAARVGGGILLAGDITQLLVRDDTVFALVGNEMTTERASGMYSSQAVFDASGKIKGWTQWQRAAGTTLPLFGGALNVFDGTFIMMTGSNKDSVNTVLQTTWSDGSSQGLEPVTTFLNSIFNPVNGGIQSIQTFLPSTPGLAQIAVMVTGGIGTVVFVQTGILDSEVIIPTTADEFDDIKTYENGTITDFVDAKIVAISGGALDAVGPITATTVASSGSDGWFFVGGSNGLAILSHADGSGWDLSLNELGNKFDGLNAGMSFKIIGNYTFVKKLVCENNFLFVVTNDRIDRINLTTSDFVTDNLDLVTIATKQNFGIIGNNGGILDAVFSQALAVVATTAGLMKIGDGQDVRLIQSSSDAQWTPVVIPETGGAPTQLLTVSTTGQEQDLTRNTGGQLYVLTSNEGYDQSRINRFVISPLTTTQTMQATTIQPFNDLFVQNIPSFFLNFGNFNSIFATDGALYFATRSKNNSQPPRVVLTPAYPAPQVAARNVGERSLTVNIPLNNGTEINGFQRSQASGSWIAAGDFGIQVLE